MMARTVKVGQEGWARGARYGYGTVRMRTSCGDAYVAATCGR
ncbi:D-alanyl-D-alanine carboxypeptidase [[Actinomadura] parvosata subsp. kistnae]|nr:D-alanyl-D-alanine carboxypeptidase [Actinomadura parvosata subsp. kistnae]